MEPLKQAVYLKGSLILWKCKSLSHVWLFATPWIYSPWNSPGQNTGVGSLSLLPNPVIEPRSSHCRQVLYQLSHQGNPRILRVGSLSLLSGSSWPRNWNGVSCTADGFFTSWATREAHNISDIVDPCNTWMEWVFRGGGKRTGSWTHVEVESDFLLCLSVG